MCLKDGSIYVAYLRRQLGSWIFLVAAMREQERERASNGEIEKTREIKVVILPWKRGFV